MEVRLDAVGDLPVPPEDVFLSMRVGDVQKQSRLAKTRTYRFDNAGSGRFGRLEVYRRVGVMTVSLSEAEGDGQDIYVPCELPGMQHLGLRMAVKGGQGAGAKAEALPAMDQKGRMNKRMDAAQRYMSEHRLEEILADAMREVLNTKPSDPLSFLSGLLLKHRKPGDSPPPVPDLPEDKASGYPVPQEQQKAAPPPPPADAKKGPVAGGGSVNQKQLMRQRSSRRLSLPGVEGQPITAGNECIGSRAYYAAHFKGTAKMQSGFASLYTKFAAKGVAKPVAKLGSRAYYAANFKEMQSGGFARLYTKFAAKGVAKPVAKLGSRAYYAANFKEMQQSGFASLYTKFAAKGVAKPVAKLGSRAYYAANFKEMQQSGFASLYSTFATKGVAKPAAPKTSFGSGGFKAYYAANIVRDIGSDSLAGLYAKFGASSAVAKPRTAVSKLLGPQGFKAYYAANIVCDIGPAGFARVYAQFQAFSAVAKPRAGAKLLGPPEAGNILAGGMAAYYGKHMRGSGMAAMTSLYAKFPAPKGQKASGTASVSQITVLTSGGFSTYYKSTILPGVASDSKPMQDLFQKFADFSAASARCTAKQAAAPPFVYRASVGTWLTRTPAQVTPSWCSMDAEKKSPQAAAPPFVYRASVGSWLTRTPAQVTRSWCFMDAEQKSQQAAPAPPASSKLALPAFGVQASVGTWLVPKPPPLLVEGSSWTSLPPSQPPAPPSKPWNRRPSVGTWLAPVPAEAAPVRQPLLKRRQDSLLAMDPSELFETFQKELAAKDREIEELRRMLTAKGG